MRWIIYRLCTTINHGAVEATENEGVFITKRMTYSEANEEIAKKEAYNGEYTIEDDGVEEVVTPSQLDVIEAQVTYTAMMTDTLLEV